MTRKLFVIALLFVMIASVPASGVMVFGNPEPEPAPNSPRVIPSDPKLPPYDNPAEIDLDGPLHISFKGVFRGVGNNKDLICFIFVALPQNDMRLRLDRRDAYDGKGRKLNNWQNVWIGDERTTDREIIGYIPIVISRWLKVPASTYGELPTIARAEFCFNGKWFQFRNIKTEEWSVWQGIAQELGL